MSEERDDWMIDVQHVTKRFVLSSTTRYLKTAAIDAVKRRGQKLFTAIDDVSFRVYKGETVGIIGANGAGKSTLLSMVAHTLTPSSGVVRTRGTISSLLELGAGFHPDLTGRENVMQYGAIMGIPHKTMKQRFDEIVDFAGISEFIDQPVRFYSSGMYVRLGFAVAVQVDPDILLVDEVLAVGDSDFQRKCLAKMDEFRKAGKSMLLISHDLPTIRRVSDRIAYLSHGKLIGLGDPAKVSRNYEEDSIRNNVSARRKEWGTGEARIARVTVVDPESGTGRDDGFAEITGTKIVVRIQWHADQRVDKPVVGFSISDVGSGRCIFGSDTRVSGLDIPSIDGDGEVVLTINADDLQAGDYLMSFSIHNWDNNVNFHRLENHFLLRTRGGRCFDGLFRLPVSFERSVK